MSKVSDHESRRRFLANCGRFVAVMPPVMTILQSTSPSALNAAGAFGDDSVNRRSATGTGLFPDATNTGVPTDMVLTSSGSLNLTTNGQTINALDIIGGVSINASNVTIQNCKIHTADTAVQFIVDIRKGHTGITIKNCEIHGPGTSASNQNTGIYIIGDSGITIDACDIHDVGHGIDIAGGSPLVIKNCYVHDLNASSSSHYDCIYFGGGSASNSSYLIQHNTLLNQNHQTAAIFCEDYFGGYHDFVVDDNHLGGGGYTVYFVSDKSGTCSNNSCTNNAFTRGYYGYKDIRGPSRPVFTGNYNYKTGAPVR